mgnify:FL=1
MGTYATINNRTDWHERLPMKKILVAYQSKYGATAEIAEAVGKTLRDKGFEVQVATAESVSDIGSYDGIVLGSAVYAGSWQGGAVDFLKKFASGLQVKQVWIFSSGPTGEGDTVEQMKGWLYPEAIKPFIEQVKPVDIALFHGKLELDAVNFAEKLIIKAMRAPTGDFRKWDTIEAWAADIAETISA